MRIRESGVLNLFREGPPVLAGSAAAGAAFGVAGRAGVAGGAAAAETSSLATAVGASAAAAGGATAFGQQQGLLDGRNVRCCSQLRDLL